MKLLSKYSLINLTASVIIFLLASIAFYFSVHFVLLNQVDEDLRTEKREFEQATERLGKLPEIITMEDELTAYREINSGTDGIRFSSVRIPGNEDELFRQIEFQIKIKEKFFKVSIAKSLEGTASVTLSLLTIAGLAVFILVIAGFIINRFILQKLWKPFYETIGVMKDYKLGQKPFPYFRQTNIIEFDRLNETLITWIMNADREYESLKEFTENASHEMQTPLAVIRAKMDILIQDKDLSEPQSKLVQATYRAIEKLSRVNQALLLLTKIENSQFSMKEEVGLDTLIREKISYFDEIIQLGDLKLFADTTETKVLMNPVLADILLNNLIGNCIKHASASGIIRLKVSDEKLTVSNGPFLQSLDSALIFKRFEKGTAPDGNLGLGLAIVKEICRVSGFTVSYHFAGEMHHFVVDLAPTAELPGWRGVS